MAWERGAKHDSRLPPPPPPSLVQEVRNRIPAQPHLRGREEGHFLVKLVFRSRGQTRELTASQKVAKSQASGRGDVKKAKMANERKRMEDAYR